QEGIKGLKGVIITHWHLDHSSGLSQVLDLFETKEEIPVYKYGNEDKDKKLFASDTKRFTLKYVKHGDIIIVDDETTLECIYTPGHTSDHIALYCKQEKAIFSGDCILGYGTAVFDDLYTYMKSLETLLKYDCEIMYSGHGPVITKPLDKIREYIEHRNKRENQIIEQLIKYKQTGLTSNQLVQFIYVDTPSHLYYAAEKNVLNHLSKLITENKVQKLSDHKFILVPTSSL
ncbi:beta-lactamase-like protein 2, partial [Reticulomyxa filosa]